MNVTLIPVFIGALRTIPKRLVKRLENLGIRALVETIQFIVELRLASILSRVLDILGDLLSLNLQ